MFGLWSWGIHPICSHLECRENEGKLADEMGYHIYIYIYSNNTIYCNILQPPNTCFSTRDIFHWCLVPGEVTHRFCWRFARKSMGPTGPTWETHQLTRWSHAKTSNTRACSPKDQWCDNYIMLFVNSCIISSEYITYHNNIYIYHSITWS
jgi:hypothetical protein